MADGFDIHLNPEYAAKLKALADQVDMSPDAYATLLIDQATHASVDRDPAIDRAIIDHAKRTGEFTPWPEVRNRLLARHRL